MRDGGRNGDAGPGNRAGSAGADFEALARQYWSAWSDALRSATPQAASAGPQSWQDMLDAWSRLARGGSRESQDALGRFNAQATQWFGRMQEVAARFGGGQAGAANIAAAWKQAIEATGGNPFAELLRAMQGPGAQGFEQWFEQARPWLDGLRTEAGAWLGMPTFGFAREHQQRWQQLALAMADYQQCTQAYDALMRQATRDACAIFEDKLAGRTAPDRQVQSARALFDLWIDAAEEAYARIALSREFRDAYGKLVDAQMRLRGGVQREVEQACALFGMPTRTELDGAHRKIVELERQVRRLRDGLATGDAPKRAAASATQRPAVGKSAKAPRAKNASAKRSAPRASTAKSGAGKPAATRKPAAKQSVTARTTKGKR